ncbi:dihydrofolate reductase family protein [Dyadobacter fanqingshengii]|uniref:Dihydrofolate reductase family protein n=1 Tax=Dyadobacter fanqingshengii TaxID=2906443 RepID=A0A9X1T935_9BACT|nr:dihydrofolate reductase family protein [Dyadobacter fanqingshengii]MCF0040805.1 dihydrofolate reductase family protein [Dyadobacter fanqingshengii]USJ37460.1 dihydrofolate reductase family protein [Dyadobacter fanqingshengii]
MRKVVLDLAVTLDGFIEGPNGEIDWCIMDEDVQDTSFTDFLDSIDTILYGRISYDMWGQYQPKPDAGPADKKLWETVHSKVKYVFSRSATPDGKATYIHSDIVGEIEKLKAAPGKNLWLYGGANLITTFINLGLVDVFRLAVHPIILGSGKPLFSNIQDRVPLTLQEVKTAKSGVALMTYSR